jgi:hypothetical protein
MRGEFSSVLLNHSGHGLAVGRLPAPRPGLRLEPAQDLGRASAPAWIARTVNALVCWEAVAAAAAGATVLLGQSDGVPMTSSLFVGSVLLVLAWPALLAVSGAYSARVFGTGSDEYRRVGRAGLVLLAAAGFVSYAAQLDLSRALVAVAVPALTVVPGPVHPPGAAGRPRRRRAQPRGAAGA